MFDIITFGSATQDILLKPKHLTMLKYAKQNEPASAEGSGVAREVCFPMGSKIDINDMQFNTGGGGTNTATTFALQGFKTAFCGMVGNDIAGQEIIDELKKFKVNISLVFTTKKSITNHSIVILKDEHDRTILAYRGASDLLNKKDIPWQKLKTPWIYIAPLSGLLCDTFEDIVDWAYEKKIHPVKSASGGVSQDAKQFSRVKIAVNPSMQQLSLPKDKLAGILKKIDVVFLNQEEASFL